MTFVSSDLKPERGGYHVFIGVTYYIKRGENRNPRAPTREWV